MLLAPCLRKIYQFVIIILLIFTSVSANASYTIIEDDLPPPARLDHVAPTAYSILFAQGRSQLTHNTRTMLDSLIPIMREVNVRIVGRPDATNIRTGKLSQLSNDRAEAIRTYLLRQGVPGTNIVVEFDVYPNPPVNGNLYASNLYISKTNSRATSQYAGQSLVPAQPIAATNLRQTYRSNAREVVESAQPTSPAIPATGSRAELIQFINQAVQSGQMEAAVALRLMRSLLESEQNSSWRLDKSLSLHENIDAWARSAEWAPIIWESGNRYQITVTTMIPGNFPGVLRQIAESTGLNICATPRDKKIRITDATVPCK